MLKPFYIAGLMRAELQRARSMADALAGNLGLVLDNADRIVPFARARIDSLLADDVVRLIGCLRGAHELHHRLSDDQIAELALSRDGASAADNPAAPPVHHASPAIAGAAA